KVKGNNYFEKSKGNNVLYITATGININIKSAQVKEIIVAPTKEGKRLRLTCTNGSTIEKVRVLEKITLIVDGDVKTELPVEVDRAADGATIETAGSIRLHTTLAAVLEKIAIDNKLKDVKLNGGYSLAGFGVYNYGYHDGEYIFVREDGTLEVLTNYNVELTSNSFYPQWALFFYDSDFSCIGQKDITFPYDYTLGGVYRTEEGEYYVVTGQNNTSEDDSKVVYCVTKFNSDWEELGRVTVSGGESNTRYPFECGNCRMEMCGDDLVIYTSRERYTTKVQSNMMFILDTPTMQMRYVGELFPYNHVSNSLNQFVKFDGTNLFYVDHGDAYPRSVCIQTHKNFASLTGGSGVLDSMPYGALTEHNALEIYGKSDDYTGTTVNGFELGKNHNLIAGVSVNHPEMTAEQWAKEDYDNTLRNVYVILADKSGASSELVWLTDYEEEDTKRPRDLRMVKLDEDRFVLIYSVDDIKESTSSPKKLTAYQVIDSNGKVLEYGEFDGYFSAKMQPVVYDGKIVWVDEDDYTDKVYLQYLIDNEFHVLHLAEEY
ncbi:MAG: hypothetical protein IJY09_07855, partial [Lachnospiraceae bacterium]|nr:hypothetical protein [Lachnospiraceae bacterium]